MKALIKKTLRKIHQQLLARPALLNRLINLSKRFGLYTKVRSIYRRFRFEQFSQSSLDQSYTKMFRYETLDQMSPRAKQIYINLGMALAQKQKEKSENANRD